MKVEAPLCAWKPDHRGLALQVIRLGILRYYDQGRSGIIQHAGRRRVRAFESTTIRSG
jgi:hypothetical protein